jgi:hypothetical protein
MVANSVFLLGKTPCQAGYGSCEMKDSPVCGTGSGTAKGRRVGYYQGWNTRERKCDKVSPRQINTRGLTHLFYSFAFFNPTTFEVEPMNSGDIPLYGEFTSLKRNGLQTWIAIGGVSASSRYSLRQPTNVFLTQNVNDMSLTNHSGLSMTPAQRKLPIPTWYQHKQIELLSSIRLFASWTFMDSKVLTLIGSTRLSPSVEVARPIRTILSY